MDFEPTDDLNCVTARAIRQIKPNQPGLGDLEIEDEEKIPQSPNPGQKTGVIRQA